jgi:hypothetical protein
VPKRARTYNKNNKPADALARAGLVHLVLLAGIELATY